MRGAFLEWALKAFSGYVAVDELYEGPYCVLSAVDNRQYKRILYEVLDHDPNHDDIRAFLGRLKSALPDPDSAGQAEEAASVGEAVQVDWRHSQQGLLTESGKSPDVSR